MADPQYLSPSESNTRSPDASEPASAAHAGRKGEPHCAQEPPPSIQSILVCWVALFKVTKMDPIPDCQEGHSNRNQQQGNIENYMSFF